MIIRGKLWRSKEFSGRWKMQCLCMSKQVVSAAVASDPWPAKHTVHTGEWGLLLSLLNAVPVLTCALLLREGHNLHATPLPVIIQSPVVKV